MRDKELFLYELVEEVKKDMDQAHVPYNDECPIKLNNRLSRSLGRCRYKIDGNGIKYAYVIEIQKLYFQYAEEQELKDTICHELIHSAADCVYSGHTGSWKRYAELMEKNSKGKYTIERTSSSSEQYREAFYASKKASFKYEVYCPECGTIWRRRKKSKLIEFPYLFACGGCGTKLKSRKIGG